MSLLPDAINAIYIFIIIIILCFTFLPHYCISFNHTVNKLCYVTSNILFDNLDFFYKFFNYTTMSYPMLAGNTKFQ